MLPQPKIWWEIKLKRFVARLVALIGRLEPAPLFCCASKPRLRVSSSPKHTPLHFILLAGRGDNSSCAARTIYFRFTIAVRRKRNRAAALHASPPFYPRPKSRCNEHRYYLSQPNRNTFHCSKRSPLLPLNDSGRAFLLRKEPRILQSTMFSGIGGNIY